MEPDSRPRSLPRSIGAVVTGFLAIVVLSTAVDAALVAAGIFPPLGESRSFTNGHYTLATAYRIVISILGGYLAARLAPRHPMTHALVLGAIGVLVSTIGAVAMWNVGANWYPLTLVAVALPCAWLGGRLFERSVPARAR